MAKILGERGFRVIIYTNDHLPAHVHVMTERGEAKIQIEPRIKLIEIMGRMTETQARQAIRLVTENHDLLLAQWNRIHGKSH